MENLEKRVLKKKKETEKILKLIEKLPTLQISSDRWGIERLSCEEINKKCNEVDFCHSCGCCADATLYAMPYIKIYNMKIYSSPVQIEIGESNKWGFGEKEETNWKDNLKKNNISNKIIKKVAEYFLEHPIKSFED